MARVLQVGALQPALAERLRTSYDAPVLPAAAADRAPFLAAHGDAVEVVVTSGRYGVDRDLMDRLPALTAIVGFGVGYDTTDVAAARERGIAISHTPDVLTDCVADTAVGLALDVMRGLSAADRFVRRGAWSAGGGVPLARRVSGSRVGILGLGRIGQGRSRGPSTRPADGSAPIVSSRRQELHHQPLHGRHGRSSPDGRERSGGDGVRRLCHRRDRLRFRLLEGGAHGRPPWRVAAGRPSLLGR